MRLGYLPTTLLRMPIDKIITRDIADLLTKIQTDKGSHVANFVLEIIKQIFTYAKSSGLIDSNPALDLRHLISKRQTTHRPAQVEPDAYREILLAVDKCSGGPVIKTLLKILPYIFCRTSEIRFMKWNDLYDLESNKPAWKYLVSKNNTEQIVPLAQQVVILIKSLRPLTGNSEYVFMGHKKGKPISQSAIDSSMRKLGLKGKQTAHGFRASARTIIDEVRGYRPDLIEQQLTHTVRDPLGRAYNRTTHIDERREMMQDWANYLDQLKNVTDIKLS
jgi:integrase